MSPVQGDTAFGTSHRELRPDCTKRVDSSRDAQIGPEAIEFAHEHPGIEWQVVSSYTGAVESDGQVTGDVCEDRGIAQRLSGKAVDVRCADIAIGLNEGFPGVDDCSIQGQSHECHLDHTV